MGLFPRRIWAISQTMRVSRAGAAEEEEGDDEVGAEPVVLLAFVEDKLERAEADGEQAEAGVVEVEAAFALLGDFVA
jgi:hypothetical protein